MTSEIGITVRYFAAARAAVGSDSEQLTMRSGATVDDLVTGLGDRDGDLARVLSQCSFLLDGIAVLDRGQSLTAGDTVDVLPPFAGG
ncbi:molybdopterin synthase subunit MoaD2 [Mycobacterium cookii]|uniref:Molybdopterin synthase sulfur carrier subunit n=1 Tax=Mycobacterium cookii TaxID=1775 RepID=A0A7I7KYT5_9MYCO|nr:MoaD/ThiS family protein [Mycobacterium cookii]MCV7330579.1 MoaD/ThiS family protein [Mycobacterium cookii]BBX47230.1 molybdopterin synthase sulfur carrier subunit [Mycobacterium cookii]